MNIAFVRIACIHSRTRVVLSSYSHRLMCWGRARRRRAPGARSAAGGSCVRVLRPDIGDRFEVELRLVSGRQFVACGFVLTLCSSSESGHAKPRYL